jgi:hypothetical protein
VALYGDIISIHYLELGPRVFPEPNLGKTSNATLWPSIRLCLSVLSGSRGDVTRTSSTHGPGANGLRGGSEGVWRVYGGCSEGVVRV